SAQPSQTPPGAPVRPARRQSRGCRRDSRWRSWCRLGWPATQPLPPPLATRSPNLLPTPPPYPPPPAPRRPAACGDAPPPPTGSRPTGKLGEVRLPLLEEGVAPFQCLFTHVEEHVGVVGQLLNARQPVL